MTPEQQYIQRVRNANLQVWEGINQLKALQRQWNALDYGSTMTPVAGEPTPSALGAVVFDTANALSNLIDNGHATNMAKLL